MDYYDFIGIQGFMIWTYRQDGSIMAAEWDADRQAFVFPEPIEG